MTVLHLDIETFSEVDLKKQGLARYAEDQSTELLCACFRFDDGPLQLWVPCEPFEFPEAARPTNSILWVQSEVPTPLRTHIESGGEVRAWNAAFERTVLNGMAGSKVDFPIIWIEQTVCVAHKSRVNGLPGDLGDAAIAAGTHRKDSEGRNTMLQLSKPRRGKVPRYTLDSAPEKFKVLYEYCGDDVLAEAELDVFIPELSPSEYAVYCLDQRINDRGIYTDIEAVEATLHVLETYKNELAVEFRRLTGLEPTQNLKLSEWIKVNGYDRLPNLQAETIRELLADPFEIPELIQNVLRIYSIYNAKATAKYEKIKGMRCRNGRLKHMFLVYGAGPGRWSSSGVQLQNLMRPVIDDVDLAIELLLDRDLESIKYWWDVDPMKVAGSCVRGMLVAPERKHLMAVDFAGIESRITAWIFDEEWKLQVFRDYDAGTGPDSYKRAVSELLRKAVESVTKRERQAIGKVTELAFGYEGGFAAMVKMSKQNNVDLQELAALTYPAIPQDILEKARSTWQWAQGKNQTLELSEYVYVAMESLKRMWRAKHPRISGGWAELKAAACDAVEFPGKAFQIKSGKIMFKVEGDWLRMRLPSGRKLNYLRPKLTGERGVNVWGKNVDNRVVSYMGVDTETRQWRRVNAYGGRWMQNIGEGVARDLLTPAMLELDAMGYGGIGSVHDEYIMELDDGFGSLEEASAVLCRPRTWAAGLPVAVDGFTATRYRK